MIARLKPALGGRELAALIIRRVDAVAVFEREFARTFGCAEGLAFSYGRSALWALLQSLDLRDVEVILPAYTCSTVAHAVVLSGNVPCFVDIDLRDYNMSLDEVERSITPNTRMVVATHLFGYPLDLERLDQIVSAAERRWGHKIWVVQDCAHSFGARWKGRRVCEAPDVALFGLNISKTITSVFGGMLTTDDTQLASRVRTYRDRQFTHRTAAQQLRRSLYLVAARIAFAPPVYSLVYWLTHATSMLDSLTRSYHLDELVHFPPDAARLMSAPEASVGLVQLRKYDDVVRQRAELAAYYDTELRGVPGLRLPPIVDGATYSHYTVRVGDRARWTATLRAEGVELGEVIDYVIPHWAAYRQYAPRAFPHAETARREVINLPVHLGVGPRERERIVRVIRRCAAEERAPAAAYVR